LTRTTTAAILVKQNAPLEIAEIEMSDLTVGQLLVKIEASGICGKQIDEIEGRREDPFLPHMLGHEACGVVEEIGPGVRKVVPGDRVVMHWTKGPGIDSETPQFTRGGERVNAGWVTTFSERTIVSENRVTVINSDIPADAAALLGCAVTTGLGIVNNDAGLRPAQSIAVFGVGGIGINVIQGARLVSANPIIAIDVNDYKLEQASLFGATHVINGREADAAAEIRKLVGEGGVDVSVDTVGAQPVRTMAFDVTKAHGITVFAGVPRVEDQITFDSFALHQGRTIVGSHGGSTQPEIDIPTAIRLYESGKLMLDEQITHRVSLDKVNDGINLVRRGEANRCVIVMD
jgi:S-(hydroxymethyl)glutathione dehydrogenase/alcohol dehydrogenase